MMDEPICFRCKKLPSQIHEYAKGVFWGGESYKSPADYVIREEGTYNPNTHTFACSDCYIAIGMPSSDGGWVAP